MDQDDDDDDDLDSLSGEERAEALAREGTLTRDDYIKTLRWCNEKRKERGMSPPCPVLPAGIGGKHNQCPIAQATGLSIGGDTYTDPKTGAEGDMPAFAGRFVTAFDLYSKNGEADPAGMLVD